MNFSSSILAVFIVCLSVSISIGQDLENDGVTVKDELIRINKRKQLAHDFFELGNYAQAIHYSKQYFEFNPKHWNSAWYIAVSSYKMRDYETAVPWFETYINSAPEVEPVSVFYLGMCLKSQGDFEQAKTFFNAYKELISEVDEQGVAKVNVEIEGCDFALNLPANGDDKPVFVKNVGSKVNGSFSESSPLVMLDGKLWLVSQTGELEENVNHQIPAVNGFSVWQSNETAGQWAERTRVEGFQIFDSLILNGFTFSENGQTGYCAFCAEKMPVDEACSIYSFEVKEGAATNFSRLDSSFNLRGTSNKHPSLVIDQDGNSILFFVSNREGGMGGSDIWFSPLNKEGKPGPVFNPGQPVNTAFDEVTPFFSQRSAKLFFSSNGHPTLGGFDFFSAEQHEETGWKKPMNLGLPYNSSYDDLYYSENQAKKESFFVSNRPGGHSPRNETCCDDIYQAKFPTFNRAIKGLVLEDLGFTRRNLKNYRVFLFLSANDSLVNSVTYKRKNIFTLEVNSAADHYVLISKKGFVDKSIEVPLAVLEKTDTVLLPEILVKRQDFGAGTVLTSIPYNFEQPVCDPAVLSKLDSVMSYLHEFQELKLEVAGYTNMGDSDEKKIEISEKGAEEVLDFLLNQNVDSARISAKGHGKEENGQLPNRVDFVVK